MNKRKKQSIILFISIVLLAIALIWEVSLLFQADFLEHLLHPTVETVEPTTEVSTDECSGFTLPEAIPKDADVSSVMEEQKIYSFMQGPRAYEQKMAYSGSWCEAELADSIFSVFGCGLCCMANIYSTLSPYECSPLDMFYYAKEVTDYSPGGGYGAIDWPFMAKTLNKAGFSCFLGSKDDTYDQFCESIQKGITAIVLVSSYEAKALWTDTSGHYVNTWMFNSESDKVFLADSGSTGNNRTWVQMRDIYNALKTGVETQYLVVTGYDESKNEWKHNGIKEFWIAPDYYTPKQ